MRIAIATDDGRTVSRHFGRARAYAVLTVEDGTIVSRELREKAAPHWQADRPHDDEKEGEAHGTGPAARGKHQAMLGVIEDCSAMIAGGMGRGAYDHAMAAGIRPIVTSLRDVDEAAIAYEDGTIVDEADRLH